MSFFILILLYAIRLGISWWISISSLGIILGSLIYRRHFKLNSIYPFVIAGILALPMFSASFLNPDATQRDLLRTSRELFCFLLILIVLNSRPKTKVFKIQSLINVLRLFLYPTFILTVVQYIFLKRGIYLGPTEEMFGGRGAIVPKALDLKYSSLRPSSLYAEPSYLAFVLLVVLIILAALTLNGEKVLDLYIVAGLTLLISQSHSGLLFILTLSILIYMDKRRRQLIKTNRFIDFSFVSLSTLVIVQVLPQYIQSDSFKVRFLFPFQEVVNSLTSNILGVPFYSRINGRTEILNLRWIKVLDNSIYSLIFSYGIVAFCIIGAVLLSARQDKYIFLLMTAAFVQNGSVFDFDKVVLIFLCFSIYCVVKQNQSLETNELVKNHISSRNLTI